MGLQVRVGSRLPAHCTSSGRVMLADLDAKLLAAYFRAGERPTLTPSTVTAERLLRRILDEVRSNGYALIDQEVEIGLRAIAVPLRSATHRAVAALSVGAHTGRMSAEDMIVHVLPVLRVAAAEIEGIIRRTDHPQLM